MNIIGAQGELRVYKIDSLPENIGTKAPKKNEMGEFILAHSEKGHHHVIGGNVDVIEHTENVTVGNTSMAMRTLYAIVREPTSLHQTAATPHDDIILNEGIYAIKTDMEYNPFADEIREVQD